MHIAGSLRHLAGQLKAEQCTAAVSGGGFAVGRDMSVESDMKVAECTAAKQGQNAPGLGF